MMEAGARVVRLDISFPMVTYCRERFTRFNSRTSFWGGVADLTSIPFGEAMFDKVLCNGVLVHVEDPTSVVRELIRVLKPGGYVVIDGNSIFSPYALRIWLDHWLGNRKNPQHRDVIFRVKNPLFYRRLLEINNCRIKQVIADSIFVGEMAFPLLKRGFPPVRLIPVLAWLDRLSQSLPWTQFLGIEVWFLAEKL
jgi:ubiquinone/menaquinone biosynthesis C-methylase UbiE